MACWRNRKTLARLRAEVTRIERGVAARGVLPLGVAAVDAALGGGNPDEAGLRCAALHEISGAAADGFAAMVAGRLAARAGGTVLWCAGPGGGDLYPPGLAALGLNPSRLLLVRCGRPADLLAAAEEGLRSRGLAAVLAEIDRLPDMTAGRRLQLAAEHGGVTGLLLPRRAAGRSRRSTASGRSVAEALPPSVAVSRWRVDHAPAGEGGAGDLRWRLALLRCRSGGRGEWMVDWHEKTHRIVMVSEAGD